MHWRRCINLVLLGALFALAELGNGCSVETRHKVKQVVFEGVPPLGQDKPPPKPYVGRPRRQPPFEKPAPVLIRLKAYKPAFKYDWKNMFRELPKDAVGGVDWMTALENKQIKPQPGIDPKQAQQQPVLPLDVHLEPQDQPLFKVTFPHKQHTQWLACDNCHTKIFKFKAGADPITMAKIYAGEYCGTCHGKVAFAVITGCPRCHLALAGPQ